MKLANSKDKERIPKAARDKKTLTFMGRNIRITADLSTETWQARKDWQDIFRVLNEKNMQPRILYPARLSFRIEGLMVTYSFSFCLSWKLFISPSILNESLAG